ncbi:Type II secretion system protein D precursor [Planctomycetes bacterium MalM25]|nr:Type II secretion system protein D precursor [Planctomycetes bacterium MalM25]
MYDLNAQRAATRLRGLSSLALLAAFCAAPAAETFAQGLPSGSVVRKINGASDKLEITTNTSRILTLDKKIPKVQVNNPELLAVTPLSATEIQVSAKKAGVTQVNLWDEDGDIHTVDVFIYGDVRELENALATQFPNSSVRVYRYSQSLVLTGFIDRPDYVDPIRQLAEDYAPKVINNIAVGGVQQVLLRVKIYEVSRTKLRKLGVDVAAIGEGGYFGTSVSGLINNIGTEGNPAGIVQRVGATKLITDTAGQTVEFMVTDGADAFVGYLDALQQKNVAKILAEPNIVAVSGRPAQFNEGGEIPIIVPQSLGNVSVEYKPFGTQVDFLPIVLGNGKIRLEVRPRVSDLDFGNAVTINNTQIPALTVRQVDTAVEMNAGQTFAIAGLIQQRTNTTNAGVPLLADIPILGVPFRRSQDESEEIELLILVTPEFVDAMDPHEVPPCGPGMGTVAPSDAELYCDGKVEVPNVCGPCVNGGCGSCPQCVAGGFPGPPRHFVNGAGSGAYSGGGVPMPAPMPTPAGVPMQEVVPTPADITPIEAPTGEASATDGGLLGPSLGQAPKPQAPSPHYRASNPQGFVRQAARPYRPRPTAEGSGLIGPVGYDDE